MGIYRLSEGNYDKLKEALKMASENRNPGIFVRDIFVEGVTGVISPVYHVENATVKVLPRSEETGIGVSAKSEVAEREAVSALEYLTVEQGLTDRKIKLKKIKT